MEDKTFELLTKLYSEFSEFRKETLTRLDSLDIGQRKLEGSQRKLEGSQRKLEGSQRKLEAILENDIKGDIKALYDGYKQVYEKLDKLENKVDGIAEAVKIHDVEIRVIKGGK
ncbi:MAG: hypothetical protein N2489_00135 [Clostridia bacterium]|nr:hypothetical protein [Clostridia bacterium]